MKQKLGWVALVCILALLAPALALAQDPREAEDTYDRMIREGWKPVAPGVLQRHLEGKGTETFAIGPEGLQWTLQQMQGRLAFLKKQYQAHPKNDLRRAIRDLEAGTVRLQEDLEKAQDEPAADLMQKTGCSVSYGADADAYPLTNVAGTGATASATFNNTCGYYAETYAYAYASATRGTLTETLTQTDPKSGYTISSSANASVQGSSPCYSEAYSYARYTGANIFLSFSDNNSLCPAPPQTVSISGPASVFISGYNWETVTWQAVVSGGVPPYSYQWYRDGSAAGTGSSYSETFYGDNINYSEGVNLSLTVTDSVGHVVSDTHSTTVWYSSTGGGNDCGPEVRFCLPSDQ